MGIDNNELTGLDAVTAASLHTTNHGKGIGIFQKYAHLGKGSSTHSPSWMGWYKVSVDDKSIKSGGSKCIQTLDAYAKAPTDHDMASYPHGVFNSTEEWDPSVLDHEQTDDEAQSCSFIDPDSFYEDHLFDAYGELYKCVIANLNTLLDIPANTGSYIPSSLLVPVIFINLPLKILTGTHSGLSLLGLLHLAFRTHMRLLPDMEPPLLLMITWRKSTSPKTLFLTSLTAMRLLLLIPSYL